MAFRFSLAGLALLTLATGAVAQTDLTGTWDIEAQMSVPAEEEATGPETAATVCDYTGTGTITQNGSSVSGPITLNQTTSIEICPPTLSGQLDGTLDGTDLMGTITSGQEQSTITGSVTDGPVPAAAASTSTAAASAPLMIQMGGLQVISGNFNGTTGTYSATVQAPMMPTATPVALVALALLLLMGGSLVLSRRSRPA